MTEGAKIKRYSGGSTTLFIEGAEGSNAILDMFADDGDDIADRFRLTATSGGTFYMQNYANNGWQSNISFTGAGNVELYHNGTKKFETASAGVDVSGRIQIDGHCFPYSNNAYDLGLSSNRWRNVYTNDLHLSNEGGVNDVDGTWGSYTIQEGAEDLFLVNKRNGKKYKFNLTEVS